jgi:hypothetical protein
MSATNKCNNTIKIKFEETCPKRNLSNWSTWRSCDTEKILENYLKNNKSEKKVNILINLCMEIFKKLQNICIESTVKKYYLEFFTALKSKLSSFDKNKSNQENIIRQMKETIKLYISIYKSICELSNNIKVNNSNKVALIVNILNQISNIWKIKIKNVVEFENIDPT